MQYSYVDNERKSNLVALLLTFTVLFGAGFGFLIMSQSGSQKSGAAHPLIQRGPAMTNG
jgi:hypothetical protein